MTSISRFGACALSSLTRTLATRIMLTLPTPPSRICIDHCCRSTQSSQTAPHLEPKAVMRAYARGCIKHATRNTKQPESSCMHMTRLHPSPPAQKEGCNGTSSIDIATQRPVQREDIGRQCTLIAYSLALHSF